MQHFSQNYRKKRLAKTVFPGERENGPKKGEWGKRENEIECREKGKGKAPDLKSEARSTIYRYTGTGIKSKQLAKICRQRFVNLAASLR